jgi:hypothetical protein
MNTSAIAKEGHGWLVPVCGLERVEGEKIMDIDIIEDDEIVTVAALRAYFVSTATLALSLNADFQAHTT